MDSVRGWNPLKEFWSWGLGPQASSLLPGCVAWGKLYYLSEPLLSFVQKRYNNIHWGRSGSQETDRGGDLPGGLEGRVLGLNTCWKVKEKDLAVEREELEGLQKRPQPVTISL